MGQLAQGTSPPNLQLRLLTAAVGLPLLGLVLWAGGPLFVAVAIAATGRALLEALTLVSRAGRRPLVTTGLAWGGAIVVVASFRADWLWLPLLAGALVVLALALLRGPASESPSIWAATSACVAYIALPLTCLVLLREGAAGLDWALVAFLATFATDTAAYFTGRHWGRHKLAPTVSPGKTWEGAAGGVVAAVAATLALAALLPGIPFSPWAAVLLGLAIGVVSQAGDLLESKLKRLAHAKDSGTLLPGHGGLLDRLDSLVLVFPLIYYASRVWPS